MTSLESLDLEWKQFQWSIPSIPKKFQDHGENRFHGNITAWVGVSFSLLKILRLRSNMFNGGIPQQFLQLVSLRLLDLVNNNLSGSIPWTFDNLHDHQKSLREQHWFPVWRGDSVSSSTGKIFDQCIKHLFPMTICIGYLFGPCILRSFVEHLLMKQQRSFVPRLKGKRKEKLQEFLATKHALRV